MVSLVSYLFRGVLNWLMMGPTKVYGDVHSTMTVPIPFIVCYLFVVLLLYLLIASCLLYVKSCVKCVYKSGH